MVQTSPFDRIYIQEVGRMAFCLFVCLFVAVILSPIHRFGHDEYRLLTNVDS